MSLWRNNIRRVEPYTPGEQPKEKKVVKLNTNENPYPPAPGVVEALNSLSRDAFRKYPDPAARDLTDAIAVHYGVGEDQVFVGVGSDDVIAIAFLTFFNSAKPIFFPDITYSFYPVWADLFGVPYETKALDEHFAIRAEDYYGENGGVIFPNPNAPTSRYESMELVEDIIQHNQDCVVIIDEAYIDFAGKSALTLLDKYENLLVVQTFSKSRSMAGMRIGFAIGSPELIRAMNDVKYSYNSYTMNQTAICMGKAAIEDDVYFRNCVDRIKATRQRSKKEFTRLGFSYIEPGGNFIFVTHPQLQARDLFQKLRDNHIFVRYFDKPRISNYLRVTIGTDQEMDTLFDFLRRMPFER